MSCLDKLYHCLGLKDSADLWYLLVTQSVTQFILNQLIRQKTDKNNKQTL